MYIYIYVVLYTYIYIYRDIDIDIECAELWFPMLQVSAIIPFPIQHSVCIKLGGLNQKMSNIKLVFCVFCLF